MRILVIEDEKRLAFTLADMIGGAGYYTDVSHDGAEGLELAQTGIYDAIVLDVMLPGMDGYGVLKNLRSTRNMTPVLMLTARSELSDRVRGLDAGADYYLTKPFDKDELTAALKAVLRRGGELIPEVISFGDICLNQSSFSLERGEKSIRLGKREFEVMRLLMYAKGAVVSKETILLKIWGNDGEAVDNNVEIYISFLRKKLTFLKASASIVTARHLGYYLERGPVQ